MKRTLTAKCQKYLIATLLLLPVMAEALSTQRQAVYTQTEHIIHIIIAIILVVVVYTIFNRRLVEEIKKHRLTTKKLALYERVINQVHDAVIATDVDGNVTIWNKGAENLYGYSKTEMLGESIEKIYPEESKSILTDVIFPELEKNNFCEVEVRLRKKSGVIFYVHVSLSQLYDEEGNVIGKIGYNIDIDERKKTELDMAELRASYQLLADFSPVGIFRMDQYGRNVFVNKWWIELTGFSVEASMDSGWRKAVHPDDIERLVSEWAIAIKENRLFEHEVRILDKNNNIVWCTVKSEPYHDEAGNLSGYIGAVIDISERKQAETAMEQSKSELLRAQRVAKMGHWHFDVASEKITVSDELARIYGFDSEYVTNEDFVNSIHPEDRDAVMQTIQHSIAIAEGWKLEYRVITARGDLKWVNGASELVTDEQGNVIEMMGTVQDVTEQHLMQQRYNEARNRFEAIFDAIPDVALFIDHDRKIISCNSATEAIFGYERKEIIHSDLSDLVAMDERQDEDELFIHLESICLGPHSQSLYRTASGEIFIGESVSARVRGMDNKDIGYLVIIRDITEEKLLESELQEYRNSLEAQIERRTKELVHARDEAEKASQAKSAFLSNMSHELRTPLNAVLGFAQMLQFNDEAFTELQKNNINEIITAGKHLLSLINDILDLAKIEAGNITVKMEKVSFSTVLEDSLKMFPEMLRKKELTLEHKINGKDILLYTDKIRCKQIMINLISNAIKYNRHAGTVQIDAVPVDDNRMRIEVTDTGKGLTQDQIARLFRPFERLDVDNSIEGTGIGLVLTRNLVELIGGDIGVKSTPGKGSTFWVELERYKE